MGLFTGLFGLSQKRIEVNRSDEEKLRVYEECKNLNLYQSPNCMFCAKVVRKIVQLGLPIELLDTREPKNREELINGGGKATVPCLKIESNDGVIWMYESVDIVTYL